MNWFLFANILFNEYYFHRHHRYLGGDDESFSEKPLSAKNNVISIFIGGLHNLKRGIKRSFKNLFNFLNFIRTRLKVSRLSGIDRKKIIFFVIQRERRFGFVTDPKESGAVHDYDTIFHLFEIFAMIIFCKNQSYLKMQRESRSRVTVTLDKSNRSYDSEWSSAIDSNELIQTVRSKTQVIRLNTGQFLTLEIKKFSMTKVIKVNHERFCTFERSFKSLSIFIE